MDLLLFLLSFVIILASCEFFTNGVEWVGRRFELSEGAIGSVLAAVGTALPETIIPLIAILFLSGGSGSEIGTGAILGAPFMLATLALFVCGMAVLLFKKRRQTKTLHINGQLIRRDLKFFLIAYSLAAVAALLPSDFNLFRLILGCSLIPLYIYYMWVTLKTGDTNSEEELKDLYCHKMACRLNGKKDAPKQFVDPAASEIDCLIRKSEPATWIILFQVLISLTGIILGSYIFVDQIRSIATEININPVILAILISPIATELPEKFNSVMWIRSKKDTYAIGNITGAMVFQSCIPVTIGLLLTSWSFDLSDKVQALEVLSIGIALLSGVILYLRSNQKELKISGLMVGGILYAIFVITVLLTV